MFCEVSFEKYSHEGLLDLKSHWVKIHIYTHSLAFKSIRTVFILPGPRKPNGKRWQGMVSCGGHFAPNCAACPQVIIFSAHLGISTHHCLISNLSIVGTWRILVQWRLYLDVWPVCARCSEKSWTGANVLTRSPHLKLYLDVWPVCARCSEKSSTGANVLTRSPHLKLSWGEGPEIEPTLENENGTLYIKYCIFFTFQHS